MSRDVGAERPSCVLRVFLSGEGVDCDSCCHRDFGSCPQGKKPPLWWDLDGRPIYSENDPRFRK